MARPKKLLNPQRLNLLVADRSKKRASRLAFRRKISIGKLFEDLVDAELERVGGNGHVNGEAVP